MAARPHGGVCLLWTGLNFPRAGDKQNAPFYGFWGHIKLPCEQVKPVKADPDGNAVVNFIRRNILAGNGSGKKRMQPFKPLGQKLFPQPEPLQQARKRPRQRGFRARTSRGPMYIPSKLLQDYPRLQVGAHLTFPHRIPRGKDPPWWATNGRLSAFRPLPCAPLWTQHEGRYLCCCASRQRPARFQWQIVHDCCGICQPHTQYYSKRPLAGPFAP